MAWYKDWFGRDAYELVYRERDDAEAERAADFIERVADPQPEAEVLDVACGRGRHARALARRGYRVTGFDLSTRSVETARQRAREEGLDITFCEHDMREVFCDGCADGVVNLFSSFGYFDEEADHQRAVDAMAAALRPEGWLVQDFMNAPRVAETLVPEDTRTEDGVTIHQQRWIEDGRINKEITLRKNGEQKTYVESVRLLTLSDFRALYAGAGLRLAGTYGDYDGAPYAEDSPRLILHARRNA